MANYTDTFRKPAMTDETGIAIAEKLGGDIASEYKVNTSAEFRKAPMSDETAQLILAKIDGGGSGGGGNFIVSFTEDAQGEVSVDKTIAEISEALEADKNVYANFDSSYATRFSAKHVKYVPISCITMKNNGTEISSIFFSWTLIGDGTCESHEYLIMNSSGESVAIIHDATYSAETT